MITSDIYEYASAERIIVIGDIHGDIRRFKMILKDAGVINDDLEWIADPPNTIVVQVGDQVDSINRAPEIKEWEILDDTNILYFTTSLDNIARAKGGRMISLIGNHELMNVIGNFSYVSAKSNTPSRAKAFMPGGMLSAILANRPLVLKIGQHFFCHAGIKKHHLDLLNAHNKSLSYVNNLWKQYMLTGKINIEDKQLFDKLILEPDGILWTRTLDSEEELSDVLKRLQCSYIYVGHTPVDTVQLAHKTIWFLDTGISRAFGNSMFQYIDIRTDIQSIKQILDI